MCITNRHLLTCLHSWSRSIPVGDFPVLSRPSVGTTISVLVPRNFTGSRFAHLTWLPAGHPLGVNQKPHPTSSSGSVLSCVAKYCRGGNQTPCSQTFPLSKRLSLEICISWPLRFRSCQLQSIHKHCFNEQNAPLTFQPPVQVSDKGRPFCSYWQSNQPYDLPIEAPSCRGKDSGILNRKLRV